MGDVLVLSPSYEVINQVTWKRALTLIFEQVVEVVEYYEDWVVRSAHEEHLVPAVIRFLKGALGRKKGVRFSRENVFARDKGKCQYCGCTVPRTDMTLEHVTPRAQGGTTRWDNVVIACFDCNQKKRDRTPAQAGMKLLRKPEKPTSLPGTQHISFPAAGPPKEWLGYIRSIAYWTTELKSD